MILNAEFDLIWTTPRPAEQEFFLNSQKFAIREIRKNSVWKPIFFLGKLCRQLLALHCHHTGDIPYRVWFDLDNTLTQWKNLFLKFLFREISKIPYENAIFSRGKLYHFFALHSHYTGDTQYRVWFDLDNSLTRLKRIFFKILKNSQFEKFAKFRMKNHFFQASYTNNFFALHSHHTGDTQYRVWFDLDNSLTRLKRIFFKILKNSQFEKFA